MEFHNLEPRIFLIAGKARSGKSTVCQYLKDELEKKGKRVIISPYTKYLKQYISEITGKEVTEENKPRELLQKLSSDLIKNKLNKKDFFIKRQIDDLDIYSYFFDEIIIPDVRFPEEIEIIKDRFDCVISIGVIRNNFMSDLTKEEQEDITEVALDYYGNYDYIIKNDDNINLQEEVIKILNNERRR